MLEDHLNANTVWKLIRDGGEFTIEETSHMRGCNLCIEWVTSFSALARRSGFKIAFEIPPLTKSADSH
jgi:hypothetical protein